MDIDIAYKEKQQGKPFLPDISNSETTTDN